MTRATRTYDLALTLVCPLTDRTGTVRCEARVLHTGGTVVTAEGRITDSEGNLYATGTTTCLVLGGK